MNDEKKSYDALKQELKDAADKATVGGLYAHYKHPELLPYKIQGFAAWDETDEVTVLYQPLQEPAVVFACPLTVWLETVEWQGSIVPRFARVIDPTAN